MPLSDPKYKANTVDDYFARRESSRCVEACIDLIDAYFVEATRSGRTALYRTAFYDYYEGFLVKGQLYRKGAQGEQTGITINNYHNFIKHKVNQVCEQRLVYDPQAIDGSHKALEQVRLAKGLLSLYAERPDIDLDGMLREATRWCQMFLESYVVLVWDKTRGKPVAMSFENDKVETTNEGDIRLSLKDPLSVVRDIYRSDARSDQWYIWKEEVNKVDLAVEYPKLEKEIMAESLDAVYKDRQIYPSYSPMSEIIWVWNFVHDRTPAVPAGRLMRFISDKIVLEDGPLPEEYKSLPVHRMAPEDLAGSPWGYCDTADVLPVCNAISRLHSTATTNNVTFGLQHILVPNDSSVNEAELGTGLTVIGWDAQKGEAFKPQAMNFTATAKETYDYIDKLTMTAGTIVGINEVTRGNPDLVLKGQVSGAALALVATQSIQFNSDIAKAYQSLAERLGTAIIYMLAKKAVVPRQGRIISMSGKQYSRSFKAEDLQMIDKVVVKTGNPLSQTTAGRLQIAESLLQGQFIKNRQDYMQVLETGSLEPMLESTDMEIALIKDENEALLRGEDVEVAVFDDHVLHITEQKVLLASVDARKDPGLVMRVTKHVQKHISMLAGDATHGPMNPILATIGNQPALPPGSPSGIVLPAPAPAPPPNGLAGTPAGPSAGQPALKPGVIPISAPGGPPVVKLPVGGPR